MEKRWRVNDKLRVFAAFSIQFSKLHCQWKRKERAHVKWKKLLETNIFIFCKLINLSLWWSSKGGRVCKEKVCAWVREGSWKLHLVILNFDQIGKLAHGGVQERERQATKRRPGFGGKGSGCEILLHFSRHTAFSFGCCLPISIAK